MNNNANKLTIPQLVAIGFIFMGVTVAWMILGGTLSRRNDTSSVRSHQSVTSLWGAPQIQEHLRLSYYPNPQKTHKLSLQPTSSEVDIKLTYEPKKKGLTWNRTYLADFSANYQISNPSPRDQTIYVSFTLPSEYSSYHNFIFKLGDTDTSEVMPDNGQIKQRIDLAAGESAQLTIGYTCRGMNQWQYQFREVDRIRNFKLTMHTNFPEIDFLDGSSSPTSRDYNDDSDTWQLTWDYPNVIQPQNISMDMPSAKNPAPIAARISFYAPFSLLFFFAVLIIFGLLKGINLHPINYIFLAAGFFSFHLLFAYLIDLIPLHLAFAIASAISIALVATYIRAASGKELMKIALPAQLAYLTLFSYSFLFKGITGLTITLGSIATLALLMQATAKINWSEIFVMPKKTTPPQCPTNDEITPAH